MGFKDSKFEDECLEGEQRFDGKAETRLATPHFETYSILPPYALDS